MAMPKFSSPKALIIASASALILGAGVWQFALRPEDKPKSTLPESLSVEALKAQAADPMKLRDTMRETFQRDDLTDEQRRELRQNMRRIFEEAMNERVESYFAAPPAEQNDILDAHLDEFQQRMAQFQERRRDGEERRREDRQGPPGGFRQRSQAERKQSSESRNPDETGRRMVYFTALQRRASERGIQMPMGRGGMGRGGPGGGGGPGGRRP